MRVGKHVRVIPDESPDIIREPEKAAKKPQKEPVRQPAFNQG
jgi:hypothetical protein